MLIISNMGDQVWLMTSKQTDPELRAHISADSFSYLWPEAETYPSSIFGWKILLTKPIEGDL